MRNVELIDGYLAHLERRALTPRTLRRYKDVLLNLDRFFDQRHVSHLTAEDLDGWLDAVPRVPRTRYAYLSCVTNFLEWAYRGEHVATNVAVGMPRPKLRRTVARPFPAEELALAILQAPPMIRCWLLLGALAGLRCQEIAGIAREDVLDSEIPSLLIVTKAKGGRQRVLPLHDEALLAMRAYGMPRFGPLYRSPSGRQYTAERLSQDGNKYLRSVGVDATMHQLRHRFGTDIYRASRDLRMTQELLGHESPNSTTIYTEWSPAEAAVIVAGLTVHA